MLAQARGMIGRVKHPAYTGENRCLPCTVLNIVIAAVLSTTVAVVSPVMSVVVFVLCLVVIYLRGYLVPGTPTLTATYMPERLLLLFGKPTPRRRATAGEALGATKKDRDPDADATVGPAEREVVSSTYEPVDLHETATPIRGPDVLDLLRAVGAINDCKTDDDLCLREEFGDDWHDRMENWTEVTEADFAAAIGTDPERVRIEDGDRVLVKVTDLQYTQWGSHAGAIAAASAAELLRERTRGWTDLDLKSREHILQSIRFFLDRCPACGDHVDMGTEGMAAACCSSGSDYVLRCTTCDETLARMHRSAY